MARQLSSTSTGFSWTVTDAGHRFMTGKDACHDSMAWTDLDNDGCIDLIAIATESGNYDDTDHEVVAVHVPSGTVGWRALPGEVSKKLALVDGVLVASTNQATQLRGLDPRTGQQLWALTLSDKLTEDPFDGDDRAPAIAAVGGSIAAFECRDDTYHLLDVRAGRVVKSGNGKFVPLGAGLPGLLGVAAGDDERFELWDVIRGRCLMSLPEVSQVRAVSGAGAVAVIYHGPLQTDGPWGAQVRVFDAASFNELGRATLRGAARSRLRADDDDDDDDDTESVEVGSGEYNVYGGMMLGGGQLVFGSRYHKGPYVVHLVPGQACVARVVPPPRPGLKFRSLAWAAPALVTAWQKEKGTAKLVCVGHNPSSLAPVWQNDELGGHEVARVLHVAASGALLAPYSPSPDHAEYDQNINRCAIRHLDPQSGAVVTEYPVEDVGCVEVHGAFLCGAPTYFSGGLPVAYDTTRRERVL